MFSRPHWSYSALTQYLRCPLQYYFKRILKLPQPFTPSGLALGSAIHEALAAYHRALQSQQPIQTEAVHEIFLEAWHERKAEETIVISGGKTEKQILEQGVALLDVYLKQPPPQNIVAIEFEMLAPLHTSQGKILEKPLTVIIDLMTNDNNRLKITDFKTSSRSYSEMEAALSLQATCYAAAVYENFGQFAGFEFAVLIKTKNCRMQRLHTTRNADDFCRLGDLVESVERAIEAEIFFPIESPLNCSGCPYRKPCREWKPTSRTNGRFEFPTTADHAFAAIGKGGRR